MSDLLPPNACSEERDVSLTLARVNDVETPVRELDDPATCPAALLPWLAWAESVDDWNPDWSEARKRAVIGASREIHERKGTIAAIKSAIDILGYGALLIEWFDQVPPGDPFTFAVEITVDQVGIADAEMYDDLDAAAMSAKNLRSHLTSVRVDGVSAATFYAAGAAQSADTVTIAPVP
ncbi:MAG: phage tail protein I [Novosphingobium sp.]|nr:phage tail protein I [Novosphingobium sp.]